MHMAIIFQIQYKWGVAGGDRWLGKVNAEMKVHILSTFWAAPL